MKYLKVESRQQSVNFSFCSHPVTIDKSAEWGPNNIQNFPNGVFLKHESDLNSPITHGVQPNEDNTAPVGWKKNEDGTYKKKAIFLYKILQPNQEVTIFTLDGAMDYQVNELSVICYNGDEEPNLNDVYIQSIENLKKNYMYGQEHEDQLT
jgi:hypothetical protein